LPEGLKALQSAAAEVEARQRGWQPQQLSHSDGAVREVERVDDYFGSAHSFVPCRLLVHAHSRTSAFVDQTAARRSIISARPTAIPPPGCPHSSRNMIVSCVAAVCSRVCRCWRMRDACMVNTQKSVTRCPTKKATRRKRTRSIQHSTGDRATSPPCCSEAAVPTGSAGVSTRAPQYGIRWGRRTQAQTLARGGWRHGGRTGHAPLPITPPPRPQAGSSTEMGRRAAIRARAVAARA
jgi:hypothetical protein